MGAGGSSVTVRLILEGEAIPRTVGGRSPVGQMKKHEWKATDEDGEVVFFRATQKAGRWWMGRKEKSGDWETLDPVPAAVLGELREVLWAKYQRNRVALRSVEEVDQMIARAEG